MIWKEMTLGERLAFLKDAVFDKGQSFSTAGRAVGTTNSAIAGFVFRYRDILELKKPLTAEAAAKMPRVHDTTGQLHSEAQYTERWEDRKRRLHTEPTAPRKPRGRPSVWDDAKRSELKRRWALGEQIKVIAGVLGVSPKAVKEERAKLRLKPRRRQLTPEDGEAIGIKVYVSPELERKLRMRAANKGMATSAYIRYLIEINA